MGRIVKWRKLGHHPGPNPEDGTTVRGYGHTNHCENGAYTLDEVKQFLKLFPAGPVAVAIGINALLALRKPEVEALLSEDYDHGRGKIRIHKDTKTGNDEWLPVVAPLAKLLSDGWEQINLRRANTKSARRSRALLWNGGVGMPSAVGWPRICIGVECVRSSLA